MCLKSSTRQDVLLGPSDFLDSIYNLILVLLLYQTWPFNRATSEFPQQLTLSKSVKPLEFRKLKSFHFYDFVLLCLN